MTYTSESYQDWDISNLPSEGVDVFPQDQHGFMMSALLAGAHIRAGASALDEGTLEPLLTLSFRSIICVCVGEQAATAAELLQSIFVTLLPCPMIVVEDLPQWFGPLDLVVILSDTPDARKAHEAIDQATRRSPTIIVDAPYDSPLTSMAKSYAGTIVVPAIFQPLGLSADLLCLWRHIGVLLAIFTQLNPMMAQKIGSLFELATSLDQVALRIGPKAHDSTNPARELALQIQDHDCIWVYDSAATRVIARYAQYIFGNLAATFSSVLSLSHWLQRLLLQPEYSVERDIFYDPDFDDGPPHRPVRGFLIAAHGRMFAELELAKSVGDIRALVDITSPAFENDIDSLIGLLTILMYLEVAALIVSGN